MADEDKKSKMPGNFSFEVDPDQIEESLKKLREQIRSSFAAGRYTKVRLSFKGKQIGPDLPLAIFIAGEGVAFWLMSPLGALLVNMGAKSVLDVEFLHEADELVREGMALYLDGETEAAEAKYREALIRRADDASALYNLGVLLRVTGRTDEALRILRKAVMGPEGDPDVIKAAELLDRLQGSGKRL